MLKRLRSQTGFTFIEAILTTMVLSIGLWGTLALFHNATSHSMNSDLRVIATQLANEKLESIMADKKFMGYDSIITNNYPQEVLTGAHEGMVRNVVITEVNPNDLVTPQLGSGYKLIQVQIIWGNPGDPSKAISVNTLLTNYN